MVRRAVYPGTFDPITKGHKNIVERATELFDEVIIAVAETIRKSPLLTIQNRLKICQEVFKNNPKVKVKSFNTLIVDFARNENARCIIKGLRNSTDFEYELQMAIMNRKMASDIETIFIASNPEYAFISSTMVREIISLGGDITLFVDSEVQNFLNLQRK